jgi:hypothetical protein
MSTYDDEIEEYIKGLPEHEKCDFFGIKALLSNHYYFRAKERIKQFFNNNENITVIGSSSGERRTHILYKSIDGTYYEIHNNCGKFTTCLYLTQSMISGYFEDEGYITPEFTQPEHVQELINKYES